MGRREVRRPLRTPARARPASQPRREPTLKRLDAAGRRDLAPITTRGIFPPPPPPSRWPPPSPPSPRHPCCPMCPAAAACLRARQPARRLTPRPLCSGEYTARATRVGRSRGCRCRGYTDVGGRRYGGGVPWPWGLRTGRGLGRCGADCCLGQEPPYKRKCLNLVLCPIPIQMTHAILHLMGA